jgi:hypothetical protein
MYFCDPLRDLVGRRVDRAAVAVLALARANVSQLISQAAIED